MKESKLEVKVNNAKCKTQNAKLKMKKGKNGNDT